MKPPKYFEKYRTKRDLLNALKSADVNEKFFNPETMRFFGRQKFFIIETETGPCLMVRIFYRSMVSSGLKIRHAYYKINSNLKLTSQPKEIGP